MPSEEGGCEPPNATHTYICRFVRPRNPGINMNFCFFGRTQKFACPQSVFWPGRGGIFSLCGCTQKSATKYAFPARKSALAAVGRIFRLPKRRVPDITKYRILCVCAKREIRDFLKVLSGCCAGMFFVSFFVKTQAQRPCGANISKLKIH